MSSNPELGVKVASIISKLKLMAEGDFFPFRLIGDYFFLLFAITIDIFYII